jgi:hypothetical protein
VEEIPDNADEGVTPTVEALAEFGRAMAKVDPVHPVLTLHVGPWFPVAEAEARLRGDNLKILIADLYVFTEMHDWQVEGYAWKTPDEATRAYLDWNLRYVELARKHGAPFWMIPQGVRSTWTRKIEGTPETRGNSRRPTRAEMRFQVWAAILAGARGTVFFMYHGFGDPPEETKAELQEWETMEGLRRRDGSSTESWDELGRVGERLKPDLALLGRWEPVGEPEERDGVLTRKFRDGRREYEVRVNRDVAEKRGGLEPGDGEIRR